MKKLFSLLGVLAVFALSGGEIDLGSLAPSYTAAAGKIDVAVLLKMPQARQFLSLVPAEFHGVRRDDISRAVFGCDRRARRFFVICKFRDEAAWQRLWQALQDRIVPQPAERRIMLFELKHLVRPPERFFFAVLAPMVAGFYYEPAVRGTYRCDYAGCPAAVQKYFNSELPFVCSGKFANARGALRGIKLFRIELDNERDGSAVLRGKAKCSDPLAASLALVALHGAIGGGLQQAGLTPEQSLDLISRMKLRQYGNMILGGFSDFSYLAGLLHEVVQKRE